MAEQTIEQTYLINAPVERVWWALSTAEGAEGWGASPAKFEAVENGEFSYWGGDIHGVNTKVIGQQLLEQEWYGHDHPEERYFVRLALEPTNSGASVHLTYSGNIYDEQRDITDWQEYYFDPIKKLLEKT